MLLKGIEALGVEAYVTAERQGILKEVMECLSDADAMPFRDFIAMLVRTHTVHAHRRWEEMGLVAKTLRETIAESRSRYSSAPRPEIETLVLPLAGNESSDAIRQRGTRHRVAP